MSSYVAFFRGINVGGHKFVRMEDVKKAFGSLGFRNVRTVLASGNVLFESPARSTSALTRKIQQRLAASLGHRIGVVVRPVAALKKLAAARPFDGIPVTPRTRRFVSFVPRKARGWLKIPYVSPDGSYQLLRVVGGTSVRSSN